MNGKMSNKEIVAIISVVSVFFNPKRIKIKKDVIDLKEEEVMPKDKCTSNINVWASSGRNFIMDKRWQLQYRLFR